MNEVQTKSNCHFCKRILPKIPFTGIGWRDVILDPNSKYRTRICNECFKEWRKSHPAKKREFNIKKINNIISILYLLYVVYGLVTFLGYGIDNWTGFLSGPGMILIVLFIFTHLAYGILNKKIDFVPPEKYQEGKKKYEFNVPNYYNVKSPFQYKESVPNTLDYDKCALCKREVLKEDLFKHPNGFLICKECIGRRENEY